MAHQEEVRVLSEHLLEEVGDGAGKRTLGRDHGDPVPVEAIAGV